MFTKFLVTLTLIYYVRHLKDNSFSHPSLTLQTLLLGSLKGTAWNKAMPLYGEATYLQPPLHIFAIKLNQ